MTSSTDAVVAIDVGGTFMKCALVDFAGRVRYADSLPTQAESGPDAVIVRVLAAATMLVRVATGAKLRPVAAGLAVPGIVDETAGVARTATNIGWHDVAIQRILAEHLGLPVVLSHDVRAGAVAEARMGAGRTWPTMLFVPIGTGIAAAHVVEGRVNPGAHQAAGEIGHLAVRGNGPRCSCGGRGCLEAIASAPALVARYRRHTKRHVTAAEVVQCALDGDPQAALVWREAISALATALAAAVSVLDPHQIVIGGGVAQAGDALLAPLRTALRARLAPHHAPPPLHQAQLGDMAGCIGSALRAMDEYPHRATRSPPRSRPDPAIRR